MKSKLMDPMSVIQYYMELSLLHMDLVYFKYQFESVHHFKDYLGSVVVYLRSVIVIPNLPNDNHFLSVTLYHLTRSLHYMNRHDFLILHDLNSNFLIQFNLILLLSLYVAFLDCIFPSTIYFISIIRLSAI